MKKWILALVISVPLAVAAVAIVFPLLTWPWEREIPVAVVNGVIDVPLLSSANAQKSVIKWKLDTVTAKAGYRFPDNGIAEDSAKASAPQNCGGRTGKFTEALHNCKPKNGGTEFHCNRTARYDAGLCYGYMVTLTGSPAVKPLDPWFMND